jgi:membrane-associated phospholipid phosphatase
VQLPDRAAADTPPSGNLPAPGTPEARGSIYRLNPAVDIPVTAIGALGTTFPFLLSSMIVSARCPCDRARINVIDRGSVDNDSELAGVLGDVMVSLAVAAPVVYEAFTVRPMDTLIEDLAVFTEVMAVNGGLMTLAKFTVQRPTPQTYAGNPRLLNHPGGYLSFYSGHTSFAFASLSFAAVTIGARRERYVLPWVVAVLGGGAVATAMVLSGAHFPTDVAMGALAGTTVGVGVPYLHRRRPKPLGLALLPGPRGAAGLSVLGRF